MSEEKKNLNRNAAASPGSAEKKTGNILKSESFRLTFILFAITAVTALLLGFVNSITSTVIAENAERELNESMRAVTSDTTVFTDVDTTLPEGVKFIKQTFEDSQPTGYCVRVAPKGFGGEIDILVSFDTAGAVKSVKILSQSETAGVGTRITEDFFLSQFRGKSFQLEVNSSVSEKNIDGLTGATISSRAVTSGINAAIGAVSEIVREGA